MMGKETFGTTLMVAMTLIQNIWGLQNTETNRRAGKDQVAQQVINLENHLLKAHCMFASVYLTLNVYGCTYAHVCMSVCII